MKSQYGKWLLAVFSAITLAIGSAGIQAHDGHGNGHHHGYHHGNRGYHYGHGGYSWNGRHYNYYHNGGYYNYYYNGRYYNNCSVVPGHWSGGLWYPGVQRCW